MEAATLIFPEYTPAPADVMITGGGGPIPPMQRSPGEPYSWAKHIGGVISDSPPYVFHVQATARPGSMEKVQDRYPLIEFWRMEGLIQAQREEIARWVVDRYGGHVYPVFRLALHGIDWALAWGLYYATGRTGEIYAARKLIPKDSRYGLCHRIWAEAYFHVLGYRFNGLEPRFVNPDALRDHILNNQGHGEWIRVFPPLIM